MNTLDRKIKQQELIIADNKTNHILHLILSILTGGIWLVVWLIIGLGNSDKRIRANEVIDGLLREE